MLRLAFLKGSSTFRKIPDHLNGQWPPATREEADEFLGSKKAKAKAREKVAVQAEK